MAEISPIRSNLQIEQAQFRAAVSESILQQAGSSINFINTYQKYDKAFCINGAYNSLSIPFAAIDNILFIPDNALITNAFMFTRKAGSGGTTELDVKYATTPGGSWASVFSTTPKISYAAGDFAWCYTGSSFLNTTAPVLSVTNLNAGMAIRCDIITSQSGDARGAGIVLFLQPR